MGFGNPVGELRIAKTGESFTRFQVRPGEIVLGDRGYAHPKGVAHVLHGGGQVVVRLNLTHLPLLNERGESYPILERLRELQGTQLGDFDAWPALEQHDDPAQICPGEVSSALVRCLLNCIVRLCS